MTENTPERDEDTAAATDGAQVDPRPDDAPAPVEETTDDAGATPAQDAADAAETDDRDEDDR